MKSVRINLVARNGYTKLNIMPVMKWKNLGHAWLPKDIHPTREWVLKSLLIKVIFLDRQYFVDPEDIVAKNVSFLIVNLVVSILSTIPSWPVKLGFSYHGHTTVSQYFDQSFHAYSFCSWQFHLHSLSILNVNGCTRFQMVNLTISSL